jgi:hypothetical protein
MSLKIRFRFDGKCSRHPRYNPRRDGRSPDRKCDGCESLYVIHLYTKIAQKRAQGSLGIAVLVLIVPEEQDTNAEPPLAPEKQIS